MSFVDCILNLTALILWLNWRSVSLRSIVPASTVTIATTVRSAGLSRLRWVYLCATLLLLILRAGIYQGLGPSIRWVPGLDFGPMLVVFRSDQFQKIFLFSFLSFGFTLALFYFSLLVLAIINRGVSDAVPEQRWIRLHLGLLGRAPLMFQFFAPFIISVAAWLALHPLLTGLGMLPETARRQTFGQAALVGLFAYESWKFVTVGFLLLHFINSYVYLGNLPLLNFVNLTCQRMLRVFSWLPLRVGRIDFRPLLMACLIAAASVGLSWVLFHAPPPAVPAIPRPADAISR
jgi:uncharacterized protein YggT (Ycf19 family)